VAIVDRFCDALDTLRPFDSPRPGPSGVPAQGRPAPASYHALKTFVPDRPGHDRRYAIDASKIRRDLGWEPRHTFETGLLDTVRWYLDHREWCEQIQAGRYDRERLGLR
jgi:dTDP-glucose 4,6-dehydratase